MIIIGFNGTKPTEIKPLLNHIKNYSLGGVIIFSKNIKNKKQLKTLISSLQSANREKLFIAIDQEGGYVQRLNSKNGFRDFASASFIGKKDDINFANSVYKDMAKMLFSVGINLNFAPSVDLAINPKNSVIVKRQRSYSKDPKKVIKYASIFIDWMKRESIICAIKHFPGHGSSFQDSHFGFVDVSATWQKDELIPFWELIKQKKAYMIMSAHIYNDRLDDKFIATFSKNINTNLLRKKLNFNGVLISDDLQMKAVTKEYDFKNSLKLAINSGVDMLLFANQVDKIVPINKIVDEILKLVKTKEIDINLIKQSNKRIKTLKNLY